MQTHAHAREIVAGGITREERQRGMGEGGKKYILKKILKKNLKRNSERFLVFWSSNGGVKPPWKGRTERGRW